MTNRLGIIIIAITLSFMFTASMSKLVLCLWRELFNYELSSANQWEQIDGWLDESELGHYKQLFREKGEYLLFYIIVFALISFAVSRFMTQFIKFTENKTIINFC